MPDGSEWQAPGSGPGQALPVDSPRLAAYYKQVESFQAERNRRARRSSRIAWSIAGVALAANAALGIAVASMLPLQRLVPLYIWLDRDGVAHDAVSMSDLPATQSQAVIRAAIWQYVRDRESYDFADARYRYDVVSLMSAPDVRDAYQHWFLAHTNPQSPQVTVGRKGQIDTAMVGLSFVRPQVALVRYRKTVLMYGETPTTTAWESTVGFAVIDKLPASARLADPGGILVTNYQSSEESPQ
jgi:type IV secretion system protein VirB8